MLCITTQTDKLPLTDKCGTLFFSLSIGLQFCMNLNSMLGFSSSLQLIYNKSYRHISAQLILFIHQGSRQLLQRKSEGRFILCVDWV